MFSRCTLSSRSGSKGLPVLGGDVAHALDDQLACASRVQFQPHTQGRRRALARVVVGCGADAAAGKHEFAAAEGVLASAAVMRGRSSPT